MNPVAPSLGFGNRLRLKIARSRSMLQVIVNHVLNSPDRRIRDRLFSCLGEAQGADFVYAKHGTERYLVHSKDRVIGREVFVSGQFDFDKVTAALKTVAQHTGLAKIQTLVDIGANIGTVCVPAVARGMVERAIAIEPDPINGRLLKINALLNDVEPRVTVHQCAVGEHDDGKLILERSADNWGDHRIRVSTADGSFGEAARPRIEVPSMRLDTLVPASQSGGMLLWMDTQGYEGYVLKGAAGLLAKQVPLVSEFWPYGMKRTGSFQDFRQAIAHYRGYIDLSAEQEGLQPIARLDALFSKLDDGKEPYTDIVVV
jgi:FkbM family methyltransferase